MKPKNSPNLSGQQALFHVRLDALVDMAHPLVQLADQIDWEGLGRKLSEPFHEYKGAPAKPVRLMAGLQYLKHTYNLSDEVLLQRWVENPYWQFFCGRLYFEYEPPIHPTSMTKWRHLHGDNMEILLRATIGAGLATGTITPRSLDKVNVDTTVQEKAITYPTDAKLFHRMREKLVKWAARWNLPLRQSYRRVSKNALVDCGRLFHARQVKKAKRLIRKLKTYLRRVRNDIVRKIAGRAGLEREFEAMLAMADRLLAQKREDKRKLYSLHAPEVECIAKGKAHKKYEFGNKASFATTSREGFVVGAMGLHGNPFDGHTLTGQLEQMERLCGLEKYAGDVFVDLGYRGHGHEGPARIHICGRGVKRTEAERRLRKWRRRRAAIEPVIGHLKNDGRLGRNWLKGEQGDRTNVILSACGQNLRLILARLVLRASEFLPIFAEMGEIIRPDFRRLARLARIPA
jgi:IS5 family transposase